MTHPTFPDCCEPWGRTKPSGRIEYVHRFNCPVAPNKVLERKPVPSRAESSSHAARLVSVDREDYTDYWSDRAYEQAEGK